VTSFLDAPLPLRNIDLAGRPVRLEVEVEHGQQVLAQGRLELELEQRAMEPAPEKLAVDEKEMDPKTGKLFYQDNSCLLIQSNSDITITVITNSRL
jgi:hypothetical protein